MKADLHIHSSYSDGSDNIKDLVNNIIKNDIKVFALTDHDTVKGCAEVYEYLPKDIKFIPSVELTCLADDIKCHILGYNIDFENNALKELIEKGKILRRNKLNIRIEYLKNTWGIELTKEELDWLYSRKSVVKTHIANVLVKRGLAEDNQKAMSKYLNGCKAGDTRFDIREAIDVIKKAGGISVWAHPIGGEGEKHISKEEFLKKLEKMKNFGIEGLECYYSRYDLKEIKMLTEIAEEKNMLITGGSDYHGSNKDIPLARLNTENIEINANNITLLKLL